LAIDRPTPAAAINNNKKEKLIKIKLQETSAKERFVQL
jgi:hypothetical protein